MEVVVVSPAVETPPRHRRQQQRKRQIGAVVAAAGEGERDEQMAGEGDWEVVGGWLVWVGDE